jgi:hypothetical protein
MPILIIGALLVYIVTVGVEGAERGAELRAAAEHDYGIDLSKRQAYLLVSHPPKDGLVNKILEPRISTRWEDGTRFHVLDLEIEGADYIVHYVESEAGPTLIADDGAELPLLRTDNRN